MKQQNFKHKYFAVIIAIIMLCESLGIPPAFAQKSNISISAVVADIGLIQKLGFVDETVENDVPLTKSYLARIASVLATGNNVAGTANCTVDVGNSTDNAEYIYCAVNMGLMSSDEEEFFYPEKAVSLDMLKKAIVSACGYTEAVVGEDNGSYAANLGIMQNVSIEDMTAVTLAEALNIAYNALYVKALKVSSYVNGNAYYEQEDKTILESKFNLYDVKGICVPSCMVEDRNKSYITIGKTELWCGDSTYYTDAAGLYTKAYYYKNTEDGDKLFHLDKETLTNNIFTVYAQDIVDVTETHVKYLGEKEREKSLNISGAVMFYNNYLTDTKKADKTLAADISSGALYIINSDTDHCAVFVKQYENFVVSGNFNDKISEKNIVGYSIELDDFNNALITVDGEKATFSDIKKNDILSIMFSQSKKNASIEVSRRTVYGTVKSMSEDFIMIDDKEYSVSSYAEKYYNIDIGSAGTFYINTLGEITAYEPESIWKYGYFTGRIASKDVMSSGIEMEYLNESGVIKISRLADKVKVNGTSMKRINIDETNLLTTALKTEFYSTSSDGKAISAKQRKDWVCQVFKYRVNADEEITDIITASASTNEDDFYEDGEDRLLINEANKRTELRSDGSLWSGLGDGFVTNETATFYVPYTYDNTFDSDGNSVNPRNSLPNAIYSITRPIEGKYDIYSYDMDDSGYTNCIIVVNPTSKASADFDFSIEKNIKDVLVKSFRKQLIGEDEVGYVLNCWVDGKEKEFTFIDDFEFFVDNDDKIIYPDEGDVVAIKYNTLNQIEKLLMRVDYSEKKMGLKPRLVGGDRVDVQLFVGWTWNEYGDDFGVVKAISDKGVRINGQYGTDKGKDGLLQSYTFGQNTGEVKQYYYNVDTNNLMTADISAVIPGETYAFVYTTYGRPRHVYFWIE